MTDETEAPPRKRNEGLLSIFKMKAALSGIPGYMCDGIAEHIVHGGLNGDFLTALLEGDLFGAMHRADATNRYHFFTYANFLYNCTPGECYGTAAKVKAWKEAGGIVGKGLEDARDWAAMGDELSRGIGA